MTAETAKEEAPPSAPPAATSEAADADVNSSQEIVAESSQSSESKTEEDAAKQSTEQKDVEMSAGEDAVASKEHGDVEMKEKEDEGDVNADVEMAEAQEETKDATRAEETTEDVEPSAAKAVDDLKKEEAAAAVEKDANEGASGETDQTKEEESSKPMDKDVTTTVSGSVNEPSEKAQEDSTAGPTPADKANGFSPKREEAVKTSKTSNGAAEPAAKKQKVETTNVEKAAVAAAVPNATDATPPVMLSRDDMAKMEEDSGRLKFEVITNDGTKEHLIQLTTLKNIFAKQLPKMPKEYIVRLVFNRNHRSMLILKNGTHVIGGICYRPFESQKFAEIAFCAINASDQVQGYGTRLMNHLKEYVKTKNINYFLTYADNYAIGYFKKQGFTKIVSMPRLNWYGYIKDYDGGTLMECTIHNQINYLRITSMIHMQRKAIQDRIKARSRALTVYPGLDKFADGRLMDIYMVPGVKEAGWSQAVIRNNRIGTRDQGSLKSQLSQLLKGITNHRSAWPFHEPVDTSVVVDYLDHIKEPVDLQLIGKRIESGAYISKAAFKADLEKMCNNCTTYNTPDTNYYKAAVDLKEFIQARIQVRDHK
ncbi:Histone acetyltransferase kat2b [Phytophthora boehmeriae]|uniref:histone acetyltransferase n=1 Tax=Phytophthora boehmeriae TaxID=109152 RepID=A0A8T1X920_9STRA|nr:Histone acetyltransferase kat2b [Phytophthora boehmeriae]